MNFEKVNRVSWVKSKERDIDVALESIYIVGHSKKFFVKNGIDFQVRNHLALYDGKLYFDNRDLENARAILIKKGDNLFSYVTKISANFIKLANDYESFLSEYKDYNYRNISKNDLGKIYLKYLNHNYNLIPYSFAISMIVEDVVKDILLKYLKKYSADPYSLYSNIIISPKNNLLTEEYLSKIKLAKIYKKNKNSKRFKEASLSHLEKYAWLYCYRPTDSGLSEQKLIKDIEAYVNPDKELDNFNKKHFLHLKNAEDFLNHNKIASNFLGLIKFMQENIWIRTYRRELMSKGFFLMRPMYKAIAKEIGVNFKDLEYIASWEIDEYFKFNKKIKSNNLKKKRKVFALIKIGKMIDVIDSVDFSKIRIRKEMVDFREYGLSGQKCYGGIISGVIQKIKTKKDLNNFKDGNILLAPTVATWMTPVVRKCSGIITESGGVLSHTAIVAREFSKPCLVGVKNATDVLKNGQVVILDANNSNIKIIK